jgi:hypothetical protein
MYFVSLNEIFVSLVCIINIVMFEFQNSNSFLFIHAKLFGTCVVTQFLAYKCSQLNSLLQRTSQGRFLENFLEFSRNVLTPLKFMGDSNLNLFKEF